MANKQKDTVSKTTIYNKLENIVLEKVFTLEIENAKLKSELASAKAKLSVYERIVTISDSKTAIGFGPPMQREEE